MSLPDKQGKVVKLVPNLFQRRIYEAFERSPYVLTLKPRQTGGTIGIAALFLWLAKHRPHYEVGVASLSWEAVLAIARKYQTLEKSLPFFYRQGPMRNVSSALQTIRMAHGGTIHIASAKSMGSRGPTLSALHLSEYAHYDDVEGTTASLLQTVPDGAPIFKETTANGHNHLYDEWMSPTSGYEKLFFSWVEHEEYFSLRPVPGDLTDTEKAYIERFQLAPERASWFVKTLRVKCKSSIALFNQEYPITPAVAFIASGDRFFSVTFEIPLGTLDHHGWMFYAEPVEHGTYVAGIDPASGSTGGDFSAVVILDVTGEEKVKRPEVVATYYARVTLDAFARDTIPMMVRYKALAVPERNAGWGLWYIEKLTNSGYEWIYRRSVPGKIKGTFTEELGYSTTRGTRDLALVELQRLVNSGRLMNPCPRLKAEMNTFVYATPKRAEATEGKHDDLVMACALAVASIEQAPEHQFENRRKNQFSSAAEMERYTAQTGMEAQYIDPITAFQLKKLDQDARKRDPGPVFDR